MKRSMLTETLFLIFEKKGQEALGKNLIVNLLELIQVKKIMI